MAKHIEDIFKDNPELLEKKEVKELIEQFRLQFRSLQNDKQAYYDKVTNVIMSTNFYHIEGLASDDAINKLIEISF